MSFENIIAHVEKRVTLTKNEVVVFTSMLRTRTVMKGEKILSEGQACRGISYVESGLLRSFCIDRKGNDRTVMFATDGWWITDMHGFVLDKPAIVNIEALDESRICELQKDDLEKLYLQVPAFEKFFRIMMQNAYIREQLRVTRDLTEDATGRYRDFIERYPQFVERIPLKMIASYLGVTPQFLSVLRKKKH